MGKSLEQQFAQFEKEEARYRKRVEAILWKEGHIMASRQQAGFKVIQSNALTFVHFEDPSSFYNDQARIVKVKEYQEALYKHGIRLDFFDEDPSDPFLCG